MLSAGKKAQFEVPKKTVSGYSTLYGGEALTLYIGKERYDRMTV